MLEQLPFAAGIRAQIDGYSYQPITTVYLRYDRPVPVPARMLQLGDGPGQWLFDRSAPGAAHAMLAVVISADGPHQSLAQADLVRAIALQLRANLPGLDPGGRPPGRASSPSGAQRMRARRSARTRQPGTSDPGSIWRATTPTRTIRQRWRRRREAGFARRKRALLAAIGADVNAVASQPVWVRA